MSSFSARAGTTTLVSLDGIEDRDRLDRDPVVVRGGEGHGVALEPAQDAGEDRAGLVGRGGERGLLQGPLQDVLGDPRRRPLAGGLDRRELLGVDALDVRLERGRHSTWSVSPAPSLEVDALAARERADEVGQEAGRARWSTPSVSTLPGTQYMSPISRLVVVRRSPPSSVLRRTLASTGSVLLLETARLTTEGRVPGSPA